MKEEYQKLNYFMHLFLKLLFEVYYDEFIVKGSFAQYANIGDIIRPLTDIDLSIYNLNEAYILLSELAKISKEFSFRFRIVSEEMLDNGTLRLGIECKNSIGKKNIQIDLNDRPTHNPVFRKLILPNTQTSFQILTVSLEEHISRKICGSIYECALEFNNGAVFRRCRDLYDIYYLLKYDFNIELVKKMMEAEKIDNLDLICQILRSEDFISRNTKRYNFERDKKEFKKDVSFETIVKEACDGIFSLTLK